jgi:hypothetical protein
MKLCPRSSREVDVLAEVHPLGVVAAGLTRSDPVLEVMPDVRAGQVYGRPACFARNAEVARVLFGDDERFRGRLSGMSGWCESVSWVPTPGALHGLLKIPSVERAGIGVERGTPE